MLYVSQILSRPIFDLRNEQIAVINDVLVRYGDEEYPPVIGLVARYRRRNFFMPSRDFSDLGLQGAKMRSTILDLSPFIRREGEVLLGKDVLESLMTCKRRLTRNRRHIGRNIMRHNLRINLAKLPVDKILGKNEF